MTIIVVSSYVDFSVLFLGLLLPANLDRRAFGLQHDGCERTLARLEDPEPHLETGHILSQREEVKAAQNHRPQPVIALPMHPAEFLVKDDF